jgi:ATP-dependent RNA helicase
MSAAASRRQTPQRHSEHYSNRFHTHPEQTATMADGIDRKAEERMEFSTSKEVTVAPTFEAMHLKENLLRGIYAYGYESPSAVQSRAIVQICKGRDTIAQAQSGTGKTATFSISILQVIDTAVRETQGMVAEHAAWSLSEC